MVVQSVSSMICMINGYLYKRLEPPCYVPGPSVESDGIDNINAESEKLGEMNNIVYVFDIDGTLADCTHRLGLIDKRIHPLAKDRDYNRFFDEVGDDAPIECMVSLCHTLIHNNQDVVFLTGRRERTRKATVNWLNENGLTVGIAMTSPKRDNISNLIMRSDGDTRPSPLCKKDLICEYFLRSELDKALFFEDAPDNIKMMREELNLNVVAVGDGLSCSEGHFETDARAHIDEYGNG